MKYNSPIPDSRQDIANELAEMNRLKKIDLKLKYHIADSDAENMGLNDEA